jgi:hypothetical protein
MKKKRPRPRQPAASLQKHLSAHLQAAKVSHVRRMRAAAGAAKKRVLPARIARIAIRAGNAESVGAGGFPALPKTGSVTLFRWPGDIIAAGYASTARPRHFLRVESGDFPKHLLRAYEKLKRGAGRKAVISLVEIRALHAHLAWARVAGRGAHDIIIPLLPNTLSLKTGKEYRRAEVEKAIATVAERRSSRDQGAQ